jgi:hypothetical protein
MDQINEKQHLVLTFRIILFTSLLVGSLSSTSQASNIAEEHQFDVLRNGKLIGSHKVRTMRGAGSTRVTATTQIEIRFLGIAFYRFSYQAEELWDAQGLKLLTASVDDDGESLDLSGRRIGNSFEWSTDDARFTHPLPVFPTNHWNNAVLNHNYVINTVTGKLNRVDILNRGRELVSLPSTSVPATRYSYRGELELDSWYDEQNRWIAMRFKGKDGSEIEYLCRSCSRETVM